MSFKHVNRGVRVTSWSAVFMSTFRTNSAAFNLGAGCRGSALFDTTFLICSNFSLRRAFDTNNTANSANAAMWERKLNPGEVETFIQLIIEFV